MRLSQIGRVDGGESRGQLVQGTDGQGREVGDLIGYGQLLAHLLVGR